MYIKILQIKSMGIEKLNGHIFFKLAHYIHILVSSIVYGMKHTVQEFLLHHDLLGVQIFHIMEKGLFIVQMIKSKANNVCMRGQDN